MFGSFIYIIIVLLIFTTYQPTDSLFFSLPESILTVFGTSLIFAFFIRFRFFQLEKGVGTVSLARLDSRFNGIMIRQSIVAILVSAFNIYFSNLVEHIGRIPIFQTIPTLQTLVFILLFIGYLAWIWHSAYPLYKIIYATRVSRTSYVRSQILFTVPVLLPWLLLSGIQDLILALPFEFPRHLLLSTQGQIAYFLFFLTAVAVTAPLIVQKSWGCSPLEAGESRSRIEALCRKARLEYADILYWPIFEGRMITAGVMGLVRRFRYILVTEALLNTLSRQEVDAVIAHEIGHVKRRHLQFYLFFFAGYMILSFAAFDLVQYRIILTKPVFRFILHTNMDLTTVSSAIFTTITIAIFIIYFRFVFGYFMRNFERQADCYVYSLFDTAMPLISTFEKIIISSGQSPEKPNWHHFSIAQRVRYLLKCEQDRRWIVRQDRKLFKSICIYVVFMIFIGIGGLSMNFDEQKRAVNADFFRQIIRTEITKHPDDAMLHMLLADLNIEDKKETEAAASYQAALKLAPDNAHALNNLAWLLATSDNRALRDPARALKLARRAAEISDAPHVLDTLAECLFLNGNIEEAVKLERRALESAVKNREHYVKQLEKFEKAGK